MATTVIILRTFCLFNIGEKASDNDYVIMITVFDDGSDDNILPVQYR